MHRDGGKFPTQKSTRIQTVNSQETPIDRKDLTGSRRIFASGQHAEDIGIQRSEGKKCIWSLFRSAETKEEHPSFGRPIRSSYAWSTGRKEDKVLSHEKNKLPSKGIQRVHKAKLGFGNSRTQKTETAIDHKEQERKMLEEFVLDDNELCLFNFYDIPVDVTKHYRMRKSAKLKTVSIIDTLSELALGAVDREDDTGAVSSCAMNEPITTTSYLNHITSNHSSCGIANLNNCKIKDKLFVSPSLIRKEIHSKEGSTVQATNFGQSIFSDYCGKSQPNELLVTSESEQESKANRKGIKSINSDFSKDFLSSNLPLSSSGTKLSHSLHNNGVEPIPCSSLKRTLRYLRKAVSSTGMEGNSNEMQYARSNRHHRKREDKDYSRLCLSDSEVRHTRKSQDFHGHTIGCGLRSKQKQGHSRQSMNFELFSKISDENKCSSTNVLSLPENDKTVKQTQKITTLRQQSRVPEWIQRIFSVAKKGDVVLLKTALKDMDAALIRNLSDHNGNNLWHICAAFNHLKCLQWLCTYDDQDVLVDENKNGLNPVVVAVKHGNFELTQWLIQHTSGVTQVAPPEGTRSLLHYAAKYGREKLCYWLSDYMEENNIDINRRDSGGNSSLHLAAKYGHIECVKCLILHGGDLLAKNELGFKPYNLAMCNGQEICADYLVAMETCFVLAAEHLFLEGDIQHLNTENTELKNHFKELLTLTRRVIRRQQKIWESLQKFKNVENSKNVQDLTSKTEDQHTSKDTDNSWLSGRENKQYLTEAWLEEYSQWLSEVAPDDKDKLHLIEENWRKVRRKQIKKIEDRSALDIIRYKFSQIMCKASESHYGSEMRIMSSSETSLSEESLPSEEELPNPSISLSDLGLSKSSFKLFNKFSSLSDKDVKHESDNTSNEVLLNSESSAEHNNVINSCKDSNQKDFKTVIETTHVPQYSTECHKSVDSSTKSYRHHTVSAQAVPPTTLSNVSSALRWDINLRLFFDRNPELRQEGKTCSVLEVLEPSSSESEDWIQKKKKTKHSKNSCKEVKWESGNSSSSSMHSSSDCKLHSTSCSQKNFQSMPISNCNKDIEFVTNENKSEVIDNLKKCKFNSSAKNIASFVALEQDNKLMSSSSQYETQTQPFHNTVNNQKGKNSSSDDPVPTLEPVQNKSESAFAITNLKMHSQDGLQNNSCEAQHFSEPDLIKGTQKVNLTHNKIKRNEKLEFNNKLLNKAENCVDKDVTESSSACVAEELDNKRDIEQIFHNETVDKLNSEVETTNSTSNVKKKSFLLKFSLKRRWSSKQKPQPTKKIEEITPEEFRETYSRSAFQNVSENNHVSCDSLVSSQNSKIDENKQAIQTTYQSKVNIETSQKETIDYVELKGLRESDYCNTKCTLDNSNSPKTCILPSEYIPPPMVPLPLRREPPPIPVSSIKEVISEEMNANQQLEISSNTHKREGSRIDNLSCTEDDVVTGVFQPSQVKLASITPRIYIPSLSDGGHNSITPWSSTIKSDSLSRPSSSASHLDSPSRSDDTYKSGFPLHKDSSASTEMLLALDSSTAGRQSPAPSEISKTESALSPPSDVSKTESIRQLNQLGKIEESANIRRESSCTLVAFQENVNSPTETAVEKCVDSIDNLIDSRNVNLTLETNITENAETEEETSKLKLNINRKNEMGDKPWYEVSDDDDMLTAQHFKMVSVNTRSSSEDEAEGITA
ncbi:uro-adherence factor A-like isoform X1 [Centruroides vittatus]|uniref:uro-adherence factor A-like isoform X1 n=1 Tax=Centruroides vittatus TaxID=120091 RepID=UPI003510AFB7